MIRNLDFLEFGHFVLASGKHTNVKIAIEGVLKHKWGNTDRALMGSSLWRDWFCLPFYGVPEGGRMLANRLFTVQDPKPCNHAVIIDDVWTTGDTVRRFITENQIRFPRIWVMFLRGEPPTDIPFAYHVDARNLPLWEPDECPICAATPQGERRE